MSDFNSASLVIEQFLRHAPGPRLEVWLSAAQSPQPRPPGIGDGFAWLIWTRAPKHIFGLSENPEEETDATAVAVGPAGQGSVLRTLCNLAARCLSAGQVSDPDIFLGAMIAEALRMRSALVAFSRELAVVIDETLHVPLSTVQRYRSKEQVLPRSCRGLEKLLRGLRPPWRLFGEFDAPYIVAAELLRSQSAPTSRELHEPQARHSPDFRSVIWFGQTYSFTANQAACVRLLWEAWENGTPELSGAKILEEADIDQDRLSAVFRDHPAWKTMIRPGHTKGAYRLSPPTAHRKAPKNHG